MPPNNADHEVRAGSKPPALAADLNVVRPSALEWGAV